MSARVVAETEKTAEGIVAQVREKYGLIAEGKSGTCSEAPAVSSCCGVVQKASVKLGYKADALAVVPEGADLGLGCGAPIEHLRLQPGETVLDLGSGPGLDAFLAAQQVGATGRVIGVDMTPAMLERARGNAAKGGW